MSPIEPAFQKFSDLDGSPLDNGYIYLGLQNENPITSPISIYWDAAGTQPAVQPLRTLNGYISRNGTPANVFVNGVYSQLVQNSRGQQVYYAPDSTNYSTSSAIDQVQANLLAYEAAVAGAGGSALVGFTQTGAGSVLRTAQDKLREAPVSAKDKGAVQDGVTDDTVALRNALSVNQSVSLGNAASTYAPNLTQAEVSDTIFYGNGTLKGVYRKFAIPDTAAGPSAPAETMIPGRHLNALTKTAPVVVLVGDSISTYYANQTGREDMLAYLLEIEVKRQIPTAVFYDRSWAGSGLTDFNNVNNPSPPAGVLWWTPANTSWIGQVMTLNPDVIVLSFGMNDSSNMQAQSYDNVRAALTVAGFTGDVVLCTNMMPSLRATDIPANATRAQQDGRDQAAGVTRSYALLKNLGLLDFHRQFVKVRDGYDVAASTLSATAMTASQNGGQYTGNEEVIDYLTVINIPANGLPVGQFISVKTGPYVNDVLFMSQTAGGLWHFDLWCGDATHNLLIFSADGIPFINTGMQVAVEVKQDTVTVWDMVTGGTLGQYNVPLFQSRTIRAGGWFNPACGVPVAGGNVGFYPAKQVLNKPRLRDRDFFNGSGFAGSGWNHPGNYTGAFVYQPVFNMVHWTEQYTLARQLSLSNNNVAPTVTHMLNIRSTASNHARLEDTSGAWSIDVSGGNLELRRLSGTGFVDVGVGQGVNIFSKAVSQGAADSGGVGFRVLRIPN